MDIMPENLIFSTPIFSSCMTLTLISVQPCLIVIEALRIDRLIALTMTLKFSCLFRTNDCHQEQILQSFSSFTGCTGQPPQLICQCTSTCRKKICIKALSRISSFFIFFSPARSADYQMPLIVLLISAINGDCHIWLRMVMKFFWEP